jgi:D-alanine-D-alanine ligase-like ATP-grasp enzyme
LSSVTDEADLLSITNEGLKAQNEFLLERFMQLERTYEIMRTEQKTIEARVFSEIDPKTIVVKGR